MAGVWRSMAGIGGGWQEIGRGLAGLRRRFGGGLQGSAGAERKDVA